MKVNYTRLIGVVIVASLLLLGCAGKRKSQPPPKDPAVLYTKGIIIFNKGKYKEAIEAFTQLKNYFPSDELYALKADLRIADCYFFRKEYPEAITRYTEFKKRHPFHPDVPYVEFQIGLCYYQQILSKDRDQEATVKALTAFQNVASNYPDTIFAQKAREKIAFCRRRLAEHELYIARFYLRKGKYPAAAKRLTSVLERNPAFGIEDEVLYFLGIALHKQKRDPEAFTPLTRLVQDYPQSPFTKKGQKLLASLKAEGVVPASPVREGEKVRVAKPPEKMRRETFPFRITARRTEEIPDKNAIMYTGEVVALGEEMTIRSESLLLTMEKGVPREMVAMGEVRVKGGGEEIFSKKATWSPTQQLLVMTGDAKIRGVGEWIRGDEIILHLDTGRIEVKGKKVEKMEEEIEGQ
ncbi:MAG: outer membrane protein assembly factor BamD [Deltaproteobacteria bacterium]|nr:outer membrane protein assembly factor BamD [Deltaproteobacteria bacterium]